MMTMFSSIDTQITSGGSQLQFLYLTKFNKYDQRGTLVEA